MSQFSNLKSLIEEYEQAEGNLAEMADAWNSDDECARAENDPGLQYAKECELSDLESRIHVECRRLIGEMAPKPGPQF
jgi:hypothetical protein